MLREKKQKVVLDSEFAFCTPVPHTYSSVSHTGSTVMLSEHLVQVVQATIMPVLALHLNFPPSWAVTSAEVVSNGILGVLQKGTSPVHMKSSISSSDDDLCVAYFSSILVPPLLHRVLDTAGFLLLLEQTQSLRP